MADKKRVECPVCGEFFAKSQINAHVNDCVNMSCSESEGSFCSSTDQQVMSDSKKYKINTADDKGRSAPSLASVALSTHDGDASTSALNDTSGVSSRDGRRRDCGADKKKQWASIFSTSPTSSSSRARLFTEDKTGTNSLNDNKNNKTDINVVSQFSSWTGGNSTAEPSSSDVKSACFQTSDTVTSCHPVGKPDDELHNNIDSIISIPTLDSIPLAEKVRPLSIDEYIGQDKAVGSDMQLRKLLKMNQIPSMIIWGPPGCGKTTLARIIARQCKQSQKMRFTQLSATTSGISDVKEVIKVAKNEIKMFKRKTVLFVDEIHRFNKLQQDSFLPHVEDGTIILIGATTENPSFQVNNALLSRCRVIVLEKLSNSSICKIISNALKRLDAVICKSNQNILDKSGRVAVTEEAVETLAFLCDGDARAALNSLQLVVTAKFTDKSNHKKVVTVHDVTEALQKSHIQYDRMGEEHYNTVSALHKSIRGSDDNAAIYWLARMLEGGEDPLFIARRLVVCASEDIGMADPQALLIAVATHQACHFIGMPECRINLAHCVTYLARAKKSNEAYAALDKACKSIKQHQGPLPGVPLHLRNAPTSLMKNLGYGKGYKYNHAFIEPVEQEYLPKDLNGVNFFS